MVRRIPRWFKHRWAEDAVDTLPTAARSRIQARIAASEALHTGEIRICVEAGLPNGYLIRNEATPVLLRKRALALFGRLDVWDTEHNNGVLIYLCMAERAIELVADRGVDRHVNQRMWSEIVLQLAGALRARQFETGLNAAVDDLHALLVQHFPIGTQQVNANELSDAPLFL